MITRLVSLAGCLAFAAPAALLGSPELPAPAAPPAAALSRPAETPATSFTDAVALYEAGDYAPASAAFAQLASEETDAVRRAQLHANAGTAAARAERFGLALWHLESARVGTPRDASVSRNLGMVRAWLGEGDVSPDRLASSWSAGVLMLSARERDLLAAGLVTLGLALLCLRRTGRMGRGLTLTALSCSALGGLVLLAAQHAESARASRAILLSDASVRGEPDREADSLFRLAEGSEVRLLEARGEFRLIVTADENKGWVRVDLARAIDDGES
ncbi:MAG: hypothetical protein DHS20C15_27600 [Planctomycetota bacterium]|nr:MAG: hypothetical protein DHS20C15_27600 [Planctomycetota bacterium]